MAFATSPTLAESVLRRTQILGSTMSQYGAPFVGTIKTVEPEWIDYNGHFNMAYYAVLFDRTVDEAFALVGLGPDYVQSRNASYFTLEAHVTYVRELAGAIPSG
jgi:acyl-CoA thioester hydrolase